MKYKNLEDLADFQKGFAFKSKDYLNNGVCKIVRVSNLTKDSINFNDCIYIDEGKYEEYKKYALEPGDIIITTVGSWKSNPNSIVGKVILVPDNNYKLLLNQNAVRIRAKKGVNQLYLYYYLKGTDFQNFIVNTAQGSANQASITQNDIKSYKIMNICPEYQNDVSEFFKKFDKKIETNNKIIANLEAQAQALFKYYFVDFEPFTDGNFVDSDLGPIPEGWEVKKLKEKNKRLNGYTYKSAELNDESDCNMVTIKNFNRYGGQPNDAEKPINISDRIKDHHYLRDGDIIVACTDLTQAADVIGRVNYYHKNDNFSKEIYSMDVVKIVPNIKEENIFLYFSLKSSRFKDYASSIATGTTVLHFPKPGIDRYKIIYPPESIINKFTKIVDPIIIEQNNLTKQNQTLAEARDALLPRLMAGEIDLEGLGGSYD